jgi:hypothetical protein
MSKRGPGLDEASVFDQLKPETLKRIILNNELNDKKTSYPKKTLVEIIRQAIDSGELSEDVLQDALGEQRKSMRLDIPYHVGDKVMYRENNFCHFGIVEKVTPTQCKVQLVRATHHGGVGMVTVPRWDEEDPCPPRTMSRSVLFHFREGAVYRDSWMDMST